MTDDIFKEHKQILDSLIKNNITTEIITSFLSFLDDFYYSRPEKKYPEWLTRCDCLHLNGTKGTFEVQLIVNLADEILRLVKENKECSTVELIRHFKHVEPHLVDYAIDYLDERGKVSKLSSGKVRYIYTLEDRKKILIDRLIGGNNTLVSDLEDALEDYDKRQDDIPF